MRYPQAWNDLGVKAMKTLRRWTLGWAAIAAAFAAHAADSPVALIEDAVNAPASVQVFDYVYPGDVIELGSDGSITLAFFETCAVQTVRGGRAVIGEQRAQVQGGASETDERPCRGAQLVVAEAGEAAAAVKRLSPFDAGEWDEQAIVSRRPVFKWADDSPAEISIYFLDAVDRELIWRGSASRSYLPYPGDAPSFVGGEPYEVVAGLGDGSIRRAVFSIDPELDYPDIGANRLITLQ